VRDRLAELGDATVAAITFAEPADLPAHRAHLDLIITAVQATR
jgi:hypothetical protein